MPQKDGWTVLAELKADPDLRGIPVVLVTLTDDKQLGYTLGASDFVHKPVDFEHLATVLRRLEPRVAGDKPGESAYVLVVDDDAAARELTRRALENAGWRVVEAADGRAAMTAVEQAAPALVVLDLMMPEMDGFAVVDALRSKPALAKIPVVIVTARDISAADREHLHGQVRDIIRKGGMRLDELATLVQATVERASV